MMIEKGLYTSVDRRCNLYEIEKFAPMRSNQVKKQAESVACLVDESFLVSREGEYQIVGAQPLYKTHKLDENVKFREEPVIGRGTAFLIGKQLALTAARLVCREDADMLDQYKIEKMRLVFGFHMFSKEVYKDKFKKNDVYRIKYIVAHHIEKLDNGRWYDWALLKLDRVVVNREPLNFSFKDALPTEKIVYMLGHSSGFPIKWTGNAEIKKNDKECYFEANLDAFPGSSGSPVFLEETQELIGMLISNTHFFAPRRDTNTGVLKKYVRILPYQEYGFAKCQKATSLSFVKAILSLSDYSISSETKSHMFLPLGGGSPPLPLPFANMDQEKMLPFSKESPNWRIVKPGLNLSGECINTICQAFQKSIWMPKGFGAFNMNKECKTSLCPMCKTVAGKVDNFVAYSCFFSIKGCFKDKNNMPFHYEKQKTRVPDKQLLSFDNHGGLVVQWYYLEVITKMLEIENQQK